MKLFETIARTVDELGIQVSCSKRPHIERIHFFKYSALLKTILNIIESYVIFPLFYNKIDNYLITEKQKEEFFKLLASVLLIIKGLELSLLSMSTTDPYFHTRP